MARWGLISAAIALLALSVGSPVRGQDAAVGDGVVESGDVMVVHTEGATEQMVANSDLGLVAIVDLIEDIEARRAEGASDAELDDARRHHRHAQFLVDFVVSENSTGFHADQEAARLLAKAIDIARRGQLVLRER